MPTEHSNTEPDGSKTALWALTPGGARLAETLRGSLPGSTLFLSSSLADSGIPANYFDRLSDKLPACFHKYSGHIFIMSTGIVVRMIAPLLRHKTLDPAVVVMDELGLHSISLVSGHLGGANKLARLAGKITGAVPVITTATDIHHVPAIDLIAKETGLYIENPEAIRYVSMALLKGEKIFLHDPFGLLKEHLPESSLYPFEKEFPRDMPGVYADDRVRELPPQVLILRPPSLAAGMGCNRGTDKEEMKMLLLDILEKFRLSCYSIRTLASVDLKKDEQGLLSLGAELKLPLIFYTRDELRQVKDIENPSAMVAKHIGIPGVCEAAAILSSGMGKLIVPKHSTRNVTVAIARNEKLLFPHEKKYLSHAE